MAEGTYEYECMRAELLGVDKPDYDEYRRKKNETEAGEATEEEIIAENLKETETVSDGLKNTAGKLEELNSILALTQKKINNFKFRCGSMSNYVRTKLGGLSSSSSVDYTSTKRNDDATTESDRKESPLEKRRSMEPTRTDRQATIESNHVSTRNDQKPARSDLSKALDGHVDKLDLLLEKSEAAQYSMEHQRKQMDKFLKK